MIPYPKTQNLFCGHAEETQLFSYRMPEVELLANEPIWHVTEKLDGANMRIIFSPDGTYEVRGRTDQANLSSGGLKRVLEFIDSNLPSPDVIREVLPFGGTLYGEGIGPGIQKGGGYGFNRFVAFDLRSHGDTQFWSDPDYVAAVTADLELPYAPWHVGIRSVIEALTYVRGDCKSLLGDFTAEGLICVPRTAMLNKYGSRIKCKIKKTDFL